ncbi:MAG: hypothetical protein JNM18_17065 [Planctomycetaceae bacterium]|nr:hypothetical protein [Planctomycetaceae bacterium]
MLASLWPGMIATIGSVASSWVTITLLIAAWAVVGVSFRTLRHTTLNGAWVWAVLAMLGLSGICFSGPDVSPLVPFVAGVMTLGPGVAVLGAKRPQHHAWHFIVLTSLVMLTMPAVEGLMFGHGRMPELHVARQGLIVALIALNWANYIATRFAIPITVFAVGQMLLLARYLSWFCGPIDDDLTPAGINWVFLAVVLAWLIRRRRRQQRDEIDAAWLPFRDSYGAAWSLRVAERFNATAKANDWPIELHWSGWQAAAEKPEPKEVDPAWVQCLDALLRRFVSREWLEAHRSS